MFKAVSPFGGLVLACYNHLGSDDLATFKTPDSPPSFTPMGAKPVTLKVEINKRHKCF